MCAQAGAQACPSAGVQARAQGRRRTRVPERARVHGLILPTLLYINPLTERVPVYVWAHTGSGGRI